MNMEVKFPWDQTRPVANCSLHSEVSTCVGNQVRWQRGRHHEDWAQDERGLWKSPSPRLGDLENWGDDQLVECLPCKLWEPGSMARTYAKKSGIVVWASITGAGEVNTWIPGVYWPVCCHVGKLQVSRKSKKKIQGGGPSEKDIWD